MAIDTLKHSEQMLRSVKYKMRNKNNQPNKFINKQANRVCSVNLIFQILNLWAGKWVWRLPGLAFRYSKYWVRLLAPFSRSRKSENKWRNEWINKYISCSKPVSTSSIGSVTTLLIGQNILFCVWSHATIKKILGIIVFEIRDYLYKKRPYDQKYFHHCS